MIMVSYGIQKVNSDFRSKISDFKSLPDNHLNLKSAIWDRKSDLHFPESGSGAGGNGLGGVARTGLAASGGGNGEISLVFPLTGPGKPGPTLERDGLDGRPVLIANHFAPGARCRPPGLAPRCLRSKGAARRWVPGKQSRANPERRWIHLCSSLLISPPVGFAVSLRWFEFCIGLRDQEYPTKQARRDFK